MHTTKKIVILTVYLITALPIFCGKDSIEDKQQQINKVLYYTYKASLECIAKKTGYSQLAYYLSMKMWQPTKAPLVPKEVTEELLNAGILQNNLNVNNPKIIALLFEDSSLLQTLVYSAQWSGIDNAAKKELL